MYVPANPHEAYVFGVKKATEPISVNNIADAYVNNTLADRRKILLTKKVTKWFAVYNNDGSGSLRVVGQFTNYLGNGRGNAELFDTEEKALDRLIGLDAVGAFPFEVEVEL